MYSNYVCGNPGCHEEEDLHTDHNHKCCPKGKFKGRKESCGECVRGWLCRWCNQSLGMLREDLAKIRGLADYADGMY